MGRLRVCSLVSARASEPVPEVSGKCLAREQKLRALTGTTLDFEAAALAVTSNRT